MPESFIKEATRLAHEHDIYVSTGDWAEYLLQKGSSSLNEYIQVTRVIIRVRKWLVSFNKADIPPTHSRAYGAYVVPTPRTSKCVEDVDFLIRKAEGCLEAGADMILMDAEDVCKYVDSVRVDIIAKVIGRLGIEKTMFEASN
ncbi:hypothetical protein R6Q57_009916 [Mikania cordata]